MAIVTLIVVGVLLNVNGHKRWGWALIIGGILAALGAAL